MRHSVSAVRKHAAVMGLVVSALFAMTTSATTISLSGNPKGGSGGYYNLRFGALRLALTGEMSLTYNDNVDESAHDEETGWALTPGVTLGIDWPISPYLQVDSSLRLAYEWYFAGDGENDFLIDGGDGVAAANIGAQLKLGQTGELLLNQSVSRRIDSLDIARGQEGDDTDNYALTETESSIQYSAELTHLVRGALKYAFTAQWADEDEYDYQDLERHRFESGLFWQTNRNLNLGPYVNYEMTEYWEDEHNDGDNLEIGLSALFAGTERGASLRGTLGYQWLSFDDDNNPDATDDYNGMTASLEARFMTSERTTHSLGASYSATHGTIEPSANYSEDLTFSYAVGYLLTERVALNADVSWLDYDESDGQEDGDIWRVGLGTGYRLNERTDLSVRYQYTTKSSSESDQEYDQNRIDLRVSYRF